jgi:hypothetical protein
MPEREPWRRRGVNRIAAGGGGTAANVIAGQLVRLLFLWQCLRMPLPYRKDRPYPGKSWTLADAAAANQLVVLRCNYCRRLMRFLAADLVTLFDPQRDALKPPFRCSRCGFADYLSVKLHWPQPGDYGHLTVRRPAGVVRVQKWKTVKLGE